MRLVEKSITRITENLFKSMLETAVLNSYFLFHKELHQQTDGVGMGLPLGPTFANIFLYYHEKKGYKTVLLNLDQLITKGMLMIAS